MIRIGIRELRDTLTSTLRRVRAGETIEVTHDGVPFAVIAPLPRDSLSRLLARGDVHPPTTDLSTIEPLPPTGTTTAGQALADDRGA